MPNELLLILAGGIFAAMALGGGYIASRSARASAPTNTTSDGAAWGIVTQLQQQLKTRDDELAALRVEVITLRAEVQTWKTKVEQLETALDVFQEQVNDERKRNRALNKEGNTLYSELQTYKQAAALPGNLRALLTERLNMADTKALCFDMGIDYESLTGATLGEKVIALLDYAERRQRFGDLLAALRRARPDMTEALRAKT